jgi:hypothetical protein
MTQEEINILWQKAMQEAVEAGEMYTRYRFAKLVAEKEREACALICDEFPDVGLIGKKITSDYHVYLIRARGQA